MTRTFTNEEFGKHIANQVKYHGRKNKTTNWWTLNFHPQELSVTVRSSANECLISKGDADENIERLTEAMYESIVKHYGTGKDGLIVTTMYIKRDADQWELWDGNIKPRK